MQINVFLMILFIAPLLEFNFNRLPMNKLEIMIMKYERVVLYKVMTAFYPK